MKSVLITGGGGFIGSHVAEFYANQNNIEQVIVVDNLSREKLLKKKIKNFRYNWDYLHQYKKINFYEKDIRDFKFLKNLFKKKEIDIVIHTAGQTAVTTSIDDPTQDFENNLIGTYNLLESVRVSETDPCLILCSTNKVFGNNVNNCQIIEKDLKYTFSDKYNNGISENFSIDLCEHTPYGTSKLCSDLYFQEYAHIYGLKTGIFRMSCIYGTRQFGVEDQGWIAHFIISALTGKKINIFGDGKQLRDILYVTDLINAFDLFVQKSDENKHGVFCMGGGPNNILSLLELIELLETELNREIETEFFDWRPSDQKVFISNIQKAKDVLDWKPKINPEEGVKKLIKWVNKNIKKFS